MSRVKRFNEWYMDLLTLKECMMYGLGVASAGLFFYPDGQLIIWFGLFIMGSAGWVGWFTRKTNKEEA